MDTVLKGPSSKVAEFVEGTLKKIAILLLGLTVKLVAGVDIPAKVKEVLGKVNLPSLVTGLVVKFGDKIKDKITPALAKLFGRAPLTPKAEFVDAPHFVWGVEDNEGKAQVVLDGTPLTDDLLNKWRDAAKLANNTAILTEIKKIRGRINLIKKNDLDKLILEKHAVQKSGQPNGMALKATPSSTGAMGPTAEALRELAGELRTLYHLATGTPLRERLPVSGALQPKYQPGYPTNVSFDESKITPAQRQELEDLFKARQAQLLGEKGADFYMAANFDSPTLKFPTAGQKASQYTFDQVYEARNGKTWYVVEAKGGSTKLTARNYSTETFSGRVRQGTFPYLVATIASMRQKGYDTLAADLTSALKGNSLDYLYISIPYAQEEGVRTINRYRFAKFDISGGSTGS